MSTSPFRTAVEGGDVEAAVALLHPDVEFRSPVVHRPYVGAGAVAHVLRHVTQVFEDFRYVDELATGDRVGLVFRARVGDREVEGWDYLTLDGDGRITAVVVMVRPLSGLVALAEAMGARLAADPPPSA